VSGDGSPPSSYYDPPEPRHSDRSIIPPECHCEECHAWHVEEGMVLDNAGSPDFPCCTEQLEEWFETGERCRKHPKAYAEAKTKDKPAFCEECQP